MGEPEVPLLRTLHVHDVDRVVVRLQSLYALSFLSGFLSMVLTSVQ